MAHRTERAETLYVCQECGKGVTEPENERHRTECGGRLLDTTVPHD